MATQARFLKPDHYPPLTAEQMADNAARFLQRTIGGFMSGAERRAIARGSLNPGLREAARILDDYDAQRANGGQR